MIIPKLIGLRVVGSLLTSGFRDALKQLRDIPNNYSLKEASVRPHFCATTAQASKNVYVNQSYPQEFQYKMSAMGKV